MKNKGTILSLLILATSSSIFPNATVHASNFYIGASTGEAHGKIGWNTADDEQAYTFSFGSSFDIPLFPIRLELEHATYKMSDKQKSQIRAHALGLNTYMSLPILPILIPYIGVGLSSTHERYISPSNTLKRSEKIFTPQYMAGIDLDLPTIALAGSLEFRRLKKNFNFDFGDLETKYNIFLVKARVKF